MPSFHARNNNTSKRDQIYHENIISSTTDLLENVVSSFASHSKPSQSLGRTKNTKLLPVFSRRSSFLLHREHGANNHMLLHSSRQSHGQQSEN